MEFKPGDYVHKMDHHQFQGYVISSGMDGDTEIVTVQHYPEKWIFHFRGNQLLFAAEKTMDIRNKI